MPFRKPAAAGSAAMSKRWCRWVLVIGGCRVKSCCEGQPRLREIPFTDAIMALRGPIEKGAARLVRRSGYRDRDS